MNKNFLDTDNFVCPYVRPILIPTQIQNRGKEMRLVKLIWLSAIRPNARTDEFTNKVTKRVASVMYGY